MTRRDDLEPYAERVVEFDIVNYPEWIFHGFFTEWMEIIDEQVKPVLHKWNPDRCTKGEHAFLIIGDRVTPRHQSRQ